MAPGVAEFGDLRSDAGVTKLNEFMASHSYVTGWSPSKNDAVVFGKLLGPPNKDKMPHAARWYRHINRRCPKASPKTEEKIDLFGEEPEAQKKGGAELPKEKKVVINKSLLVLEIKPNKAETDLIEVHRLVKEIAMEGLSWGNAYKKIPVAFGVYKLQVSCVIIDDLVNTSDITDRIEEIGMSEEERAKFRAMRDNGEDDEDEDEEAPGFVQSVEIASFNKL